MPSGIPFAKFLTVISIACILGLSACSTLPSDNHPYSMSGTVPIPPEQAKNILEALQKSNPGIHIQAELAPVPQGTATKLTVRTREKVHLVNKGFEEFHGEVAKYPDCQHWFYLARSYDRSCGDGPIIGSMTTIFGDGVGFGAIFDLFQLVRYPFGFTYADEVNPEETRKIFQKYQESAHQPTPKPVAQANSSPEIPFPGKVLIGSR